MNGSRLVLIGAASAAAVAVGLGVNSPGASATAAVQPSGWPAKAAVTSSGTAADITAGQTIALIGHQVKNANINVGPARFGPGDSNVFEEVLRDRATSRTVGRTAVQCTAAFSAFLCSGTFRLDGKGTVEISGSLTDTNSLLAVTGGTGRYQNVRGQLLVGGTSGRNTDLTLHLLP